MKRALHTVLHSPGEETANAISQEYARLGNLEHMYVHRNTVIKSLNSQVVVRGVGSIDWPCKCRSGKAFT